MAAQNILRQAEEKMKKTIDVATHDLNTVRTGRANSAILDNIKVDYYGTLTPLKQLAGVSTPEARLLVIQPWDPSSMGAIEKALLKSDVGITPSNDGKVIRLSVPPLTKERRAELVKLAHKMTEESRISIRSLRREANEQIKQLEKDHKIPEDESFKTQDEVQNLTDKHIKQIDDLLKRKETEIMEV